MESSGGGLWGHGPDTQSVNLLFLIVPSRGASEITEVNYAEAARST
jgi:hypothetical protein